MAGWLILVVAIIYVGVGAQLLYQGKMGLGITFLSYAISNVGLYFAAS
jgi:hypothetical protein